MFARVVTLLIVGLIFFDGRDVAAQGLPKRPGLLAPPSLLDKSPPTATSPPASVEESAKSPPAANPTSPIKTAARPSATIRANNEPPVPAPSPSAAGAPAAMRVSKGSGVLPNDHGQVWREYDISPYTTRVTTTERPEQAIVDWILRETGTEVWFSEPLGVLSADKTTLRVYHTPEMQQLIAEIVDRFVSSQAESQVLSIRLATVGNPNWRSKAYALLRPVDVQSPGIEAWLVSKENAAFLVAELSKRTDYREHNSPNQVTHNGQSLAISRLRPKTYVRSVRLRDGIVPTYDSESAQLEEGFSLQISPLFGLDGKSVDAVIKCHIDQVERLVPIAIELPGVAAKQKAQVQVPQLVSWRLHERFRWPTDQVLLLSCGVVAAPGPDSRGALGLVNALTTTAGRADALLFIECNGKATSPPRDEPRATAGRSSYRGRY